MLNATTENALDAKLLARTELTPLDVATAGEDASLAEQVRQHNAAVEAVEHRFQRLVEDRTAVANPDLWLLRSGADFLAEHQRMMTEAWDALVALQNVLRQREVVLGALNDRVVEQRQNLHDHREEVYANRERALKREHRAYLKAQPNLGGAFVTDLTESDDDVADLDNRIAELNSLSSSLQHAQHRASQQQNPVTLRQREVFQQLVN